MTEYLLLVCQHCASTNRIPAHRLDDGPKCGKCKQSLFEAKPFELDSALFNKFLSRNSLPLLVDFWAPWCGPCKIMAPSFEQACHQLEPKFRLAKINTEQEQQLALQWRIQSIPTLALFHAGKEIARQPGAMQSHDIVHWANHHNQR